MNAAEHSDGQCEPDLLAEADRCREILQTSLIDFYYPASIDLDNGGYIETYKDGNLVLTGEKFLLLQARQLWFFSNLALAEIEPETHLKAARHGFRFIQEQMADREAGGYFSIVKDCGEKLDTNKHVYHQAFAIYGLSAYYRASGDPSALESAKETFHLLESKAHDSRFGGYREFFTADWKPVTDPEAVSPIAPPGIKTYNSHLHLMEAFAALYRIWPDPLLKERIAELIFIVVNTVRHPQHNQNIDYWTEDWQVIATPTNLRASYGHDIETVWLTLDAAQAIGLSRTLLHSWALAITAEVLEKGWDDEHGGLFAAGPLGQPADDTHKIWWVQAEALVGFLYLYELTGDSVYKASFMRTLDFVEAHLLAPQGSWWDTVLADGTVTEISELSSAWQGAYHSGRTLLYCIDTLKQLSGKEPANGPAR